MKYQPIFENTKKHELLNNAEDYLNAGNYHSAIRSIALSMNIKQIPHNLDKKLADEEYNHRQAGNNIYNTAFITNVQKILIGKKDLIKMKPDQTLYTDLQVTRKVNKAVRDRDAIFRKEKETWEQEKASLIASSEEDENYIEEEPETEEIIEGGGKMKKRYEPLFEMRDTTGQGLMFGDPSIIPDRVRRKFIQELENELNAQVKWQIDYMENNQDYTDNFSYLPDESAQDLQYDSERIDALVQNRGLSDDDVQEAIHRHSSYETDWVDGRFPPNPSRYGVILGDYPIEGEEIQIDDQKHYKLSKLIGQDVGVVTALSLLTQKEYEDLRKHIDGYLYQDYNVLQKEMQRSKYPHVEIYVQNTGQVIVYVSEQDAIDALIREYGDIE